MSGRAFLEVDDLRPDEIDRILAGAMQWKADRAQVPDALAGRGVAALFEKPSARTRSSVEMAVATLGGHPIYIRPEEVGLDTRETVEDVARTLAGYCDVICARVFEHRTLVRMSAVVDVPVVNLLSDEAHPVQALADLLTIREQFGRLEGVRLTYVGDGNNVAASLARAAALTGIEMVVSSPPGYELDDSVVDDCERLGAAPELVTDPIEAVGGSDVVYTDVWTSMGQESESARRRAAFGGYTVDEAMMANADERAVFMHCLPAHRGEEVDAKIIDGPSSLVWQQAANRMDSTRALLALLVSNPSESR